MESRKDRQFNLLLKICERIHDETVKAIPYSANKHPEHGFIGRNPYSAPHNMMRAAAHIRKKKLLLKCCKTVKHKPCLSYRMARVSIIKSLQYSFFSYNPIVI